MRPSEALAKNRDKVLEIIARYPVANPRVFGSVARGEDTDESDLDILVEPSGVLTFIDMARLEIQLESVLNVPVGVHTSGEFGPEATASVARDRRVI
jgi:predicted nucleotidyltransferase